LEKFEMKKTLVAIAAVVATTGAMADVTISGEVDSAITATTTNTAGAKTTVNALTPAGIGQSGLNFGVTEDLGDGLTAYAAVNTIFTATSASSTVATDNGSGVGLKGGFGNIFMGVKYNMTWFAMAAADATGWNNAAGRVFAPVLNSGQQSNMIAYTFPTMVEGLTLAVEDHLTASSANGGSYYGWSATYASGPLAIQYGGDRLSSQGVTTYTNTAADATTTTVGSYSGAATAFTGDVTTQAIAVTYDLGSAKLYFGNQTLSDSGSSIAENKSTYGVSIPVGASSIGFAYTTAKFTDASGDTMDTVGNKLFAKYNFSKRTYGYINYGVSSTTGYTYSTTAAAIGMAHSF
jgi:predicted porin